MQDRKQERRSHNVRGMLVDQIELLLGAGHIVAIKRERPWASITFSGTRFYLHITSDRRENCTPIDQKLVDHEFDLPDHFVADLLVRNRDKAENFTAVEILVIADPVAA